MTEDLLSKLAAYGPALGAHLTVIIYYLLLTAVRVRFFSAQGVKSWGSPRAGRYLPVALLGIVLGNYFVEYFIYSPEFWSTRNADTFYYSTMQGVSIFLGSATYYFSLWATFTVLRLGLGPAYFKKSDGSFVRSVGSLVLQAGFAFVGFLSAGVLALCVMQGPVIAGFLNGMKSVGVGPGGFEPVIFRCEIGAGVVCALCVVFIWRLRRR